MVSDHHPPTVLIFNSQPIMAQEMPTRSAKLPKDLVAGPRLKHQPSKHQGGHKAPQSGDASWDPWARSSTAPKPSHGSPPAPTSEAKPSQARADPPNHAAGPTETRPLTGPFTDKFDQQDARIAVALGIQHGHHAANTNEQLSSTGCQDCLPGDHRPSARPTNPEWIRSAPRAASVEPADCPGILSPRSQVGLSHG